MPPLPPPLHSWDLSPREAVAVQRELASRRIFEPLPEPQTLAACDVSFNRGSSQLSAAIVVVDVRTLQEIERATVTVESKFPYVPGLLSFREIPPLLAAWEQLRESPGCAMLDGQGVAHPRGLGVACHFGLWLNVPAFGCAKSRLAGTFDPVGEEVGARSPLTIAGQEVGAVVRSRRRAGPLFISAGHRCDLESAVRWAQHGLRGRRIPEPLRLAHDAANAMRRASRGEKFGDAARFE